MNNYITKIIHQESKDKSLKRGKTVERKATVIIDFDVEGYHYYPDAPVAVSFLRNNHRHIFRVRSGYAVDDLNREREIFIEERAIREHIESHFGIPANFQGMSCEMIAASLLEYFAERGAIWFEVLEDGRGGARVERGSRP